MSKRDLSVEHFSDGRVMCRHCGPDQKGFRLLHNSHLGTHGYPDQKAYRDDHAIGPEVRLVSVDFAKQLRDLRLPPLSHKPLTLGSQAFKQERANMLEELTEHGWYGPRQAAKYSGIPLTTLQSAMQLGRIPYGITEYKNGPSAIIKLIQREDLDNFKTGYAACRKRRI